MSVMRKFHAVAFDVDGTIIDIERIHHEGHLRAAKDFGLTMSVEEALELIPHFIGGPDEAIAREIAELVGKEPGEVFEKDKEHYYELLRNEKEIPFRPGFLEVFQWFKSHGFKITIGTTIPRFEAPLIFPRTSIPALFGMENVFIREDVPRQKPFPDVFLKTAEHVGVKPSEQIVFEDSPGGMKAGFTAGSVVVAMPVYRTPLLMHRYVRSGFHRMFFDWREMNIEALIKNLEEEQF